MVRYANSCEDRMPIAWVDIETPYGKKRVKVACVAALICDLVLDCRYVLLQERNVRVHTGVGKGLMVDRETTTGRKAIMTRMFLRPRRLPVETTTRHPRRKLCVSTVTNLAI